MSKDQELTLLTFGPFGVSICDGAYGVFKWQKKNVTTIELTDARIRGIAHRSFGFFRLRPALRNPSFEIPYSLIVAATLRPHPARLGLMKVLEIGYRDADCIREKSVASYNEHIEAAFAILERHTPQAEHTLA